mmetsp:Transcript_95067/g.269113  ORF Transcript_95067/g.269113 Transcript_95067/m.269113 type:complete len:286 (-) Transcript_95067:31-888(-)
MRMHGQRWRSRMSKGIFCDFSKQPAWLWHSVSSWHRAPLTSDDARLKTAPGSCASGANTPTVMNLSAPGAPYTRMLRAPRSSPRRPDRLSVRPALASLRHRPAVALHADERDIDGHDCGNPRVLHEAQLVVDAERIEELLPQDEESLPGLDDERHQEGSLQLPRPRDRAGGDREEELQLAPLRPGTPEHLRRDGHRVLLDEHVGKAVLLQLEGLEQGPVVVHQGQGPQHQVHELGGEAHPGDGVARRARAAVRDALSGRRVEAWSCGCHGSVRQAGRRRGARSGG